MSAVTRLDVRVLRLTFREPVRHGRDWITARDVAIVRVADEDGRIGLGETFEVPHPDAVATARSWALGRTPEELQGSGGAWALGVLPHRLCAALDGASIDLTARQADVSVARLMAQQDVATGVRVNALLVATAPGSGPAAAARDLVADGFDTIKLKLEGDPEGSPGAWWTDTITAIRVAVGAQVALRLDLNGSLSPEAALAWLPGLVDLDLEYVEQPITPEHGPHELARLRDCGVPVAADESVTDLGAALDLLEAGCDALVVKPARVGGPIRAHAIILAASEAGVPVTVSTLYETGVGLATALHVAATVPGDRAHGLATAHLLADDPVQGLPSITDGRLRVLGPGLGVTLA